MIRRFLFLCLLFITSAAFAQNQGMMLGVFGPLAGTYSGPGDIVSGATAWYGLRAYSAAVAATGTQKAVNVRASGDNATTDILILPSGRLDVATAAAFQAAHGGNLFVTKWYDQSDNGNDVIQTTAANQPQLVFSGLGSFPILLSTTSTSDLRQSSITPSSAVMSFLGVANRFVGNERTDIVRNGGTGSNNRISGSSGVSNSIVLVGGASGSFTATANDNQWHALIGIINGTSSIISVDGVETIGSATGSTASGVRSVGTVFVASTSLGQTEGAIYEATALSSGQRTSLINNMRSYYGF